MKNLYEIIRNHIKYRQILIIILILIINIKCYDEDIKVIADKIEKYFSDQLTTKYDIKYPNSDLTLSISNINIQAFYGTRTVVNGVQQEIIYNNFHIFFSFSMTFHLSNITFTIPNQSLIFTYRQMKWYRTGKGSFTFDGPIYGIVEQNFDNLSKFKIFDEILFNDAKKLTDVFQNFALDFIYKILSTYPKDPLLESFDLAIERINHITYYRVNCCEAFSVQKARMDKIKYESYEIKLPYIKINNVSLEINFTSVDGPQTFKIKIPFIVYSGEAMGFKPFSTSILVTKIVKEIFIRELVLSEKN